MMTNEAFTTRGPRKPPQSKHQASSESAFQNKSSKGCEHWAATTAPPPHSSSYPSSTTLYDSSSSSSGSSHRGNTTCLGSRSHKRRKKTPLAPGTYRTTPFATTTIRNYYFHQQYYPYKINRAFQGSMDNQMARRPPLRRKHHDRSSRCPLPLHEPPTAAGLWSSTWYHLPRETMSTVTEIFHLLSRDKAKTTPLTLRATW